MEAYKSMKPESQNKWQTGIFSLFSQLLKQKANMWVSEQGAREIVNID